MSQIVTPYPNTFFGDLKDFGYQSQYMTNKQTFQPGQTDFEQKKSETQDNTDEALLNGYSSYYQYPMSMYNMYNSYVSFNTTFPRAKDYYSQESILETFPQLEGINNYEFDVNSIPDHARFYVLRSSNDDNIHKAIKYHVWSTTTNGKAVLSNAGKEDEKKGLTPEIYLIFSVVNSNHVLGVAKMTSDVKNEETFMFWWEPAKWFGTFQLSWIFIKDVHFSKFDQIKEDADGTSFINLKDSTVLNLESGKEVLKVFRDSVPKTSIFGSFAYMDQREDYIRLQRETNTKFLEYFNECCTAYKQNPEGFSPVRKISGTYRKGGKYNNNNNSYYSNKRYNNFSYKKTYVQSKKNKSPTEGNQPSVNIPKEQPVNYSDEDFPELGFATEDFGVKSASVKTKTLKMSKKTASVGN